MFDRLSGGSLVFGSRNQDLFSDFFNRYSITTISSRNYNSTDTNITQETDYAHLTLNDSSLIFYMPFDVSHNSSNITYDYTTNNFNGVVSNISSYYTGCLNASSCYNFDGVDDYINISDSNALDVTGNLTITAWINHRSNGGADVIVEKGSCFGAACPYGLRISGGGTLTSDHNDGSAGQESYATTQTVALNNWTFVSLVRNGTTLSLYINGTRYSVNTYTRNPTANAKHLVIGTDDDSTPSDAPFNGSIDDVMIYNRSLTPQEITDLYNNQSNRFKNEGFMNFTNKSFTSGDNFVNVSIANISMFFSSNLSASADNGATWKYFDTNGNATGLTLTNPTTANITIRFQAGNSSTNTFYTPILAGNVTLSSYNITSPSSASSCITSNGNTYYMRDHCRCYYQGSLAEINISKFSCEVI